MRNTVDSRTFRLSSPINNPHFDGRCKNQIKAIRELERGQIIFARTYRFDNEISGKMYSHEENHYEFVVDGKRHYATHSDHKELCEELDKQYKVEKEFNTAVTSTAPKTLEEAVQLSRTSVETFLHYAALQLLKEGWFTPEDLLAAYNRNEDDCG